MTEDHPDEFDEIPTDAVDVPEGVSEPSRGNADDRYSEKADAFPESVEERLPDPVIERIPDDRLESALATRARDGTLAMAGGGLLLLSALRTSHRRWRALLRAVVGGGLVGYGLRQYREAAAVDEELLEIEAAVAGATRAGPEDVAGESTNIAEEVDEVTDVAEEVDERIEQGEIDPLGSESPGERLDSASEAVMAGEDASADESGEDEDAATDEGSDADGGGSTADESESEPDAYGSMPDIELLEDDREDDGPRSKPDVGAEDDVQWRDAADGDESEE
ncbi:hypothetical protein ACFQGT_16850 [Natrialbaceae archaeon GCM10025810]|uniref:hypothetical protein n=1 Tax=Halovalidus salilacus TaxID=3075124 RepID=UPI00361CDBCB